MADLLNLFLSNGMPYDDAVLVNDLAKHAVSQALQSMRTVVDSAPERLQTPLTLASMYYLSAHLEDARRAVTEAFIEDGIKVPGIDD